MKSKENQMKQIKINYLGLGPEIELCCGTWGATCMEEVLESRESEGGTTVGRAVAHTIELVEL